MTILKHIFILTTFIFSSILLIFDLFFIFKLFYYSINNNNTILNFIIYVSLFISLFMNILIIRYYNNFNK